MHVPLVVHWPKGIAARGEVRRQFHYVTDVAPTVLEVAGVTMPATYRGLEQMPMAGASMAYAFDHPDERQPQDDAVLRDGWTPRDVPRGVEGRDPPRPWRLVRRRPLGAVSRRRGPVGVPRPRRRANPRSSRARSNCGGTRPRSTASCRSMTADSRSSRSSSHDFSPHPTSRHYTYLPPLSPIPPPAAAGIGGRSWDLEARVIARETAAG